MSFSKTFNHGVQKSAFFCFLISTYICGLLAYVYAAPGDLDRSFGIEGVVRTSFTSGSDMRGSVFQADGKFILVGSIGQSGSNDDFYIVRFNSNGSLDTTFDGDGIAIIPVSTREDRATNVAVQSDGKIVVSGNSREASSSYNFAVVRLNSDGTPDQTFDGDGIVITSTSPNNDFAQDVIVQSDNKIVVCGQGQVSGQMNITVVRYNVNGSLDTSFDGDGIAITQFPQGASGSQAVALQTDGKIVVAGAIGIGGQFLESIFGFARYNTNGSLDTSFGNNGTVGVDVRIGVPRQNAAQELLIQPDNKIVAVGNSNSGLNTGFDFAMARLNPDGSLDSSFGDNGKVVTPTGNNDNFARDVILQSDGKIIVVGDGRIGFNSGFAIVRYNSNGTLDSRFGNNGIVITPSANSFVLRARILPDGKILTAGIGIFARYQVTGFREADFDGDKLSDISVFRPSDTVWYLLRSQSGFFATQFGISTDKITPVDFDGDGRTDIAVFRDGVWYWLNSSNGSFNAVQFGQAEDIPVPADYTGDGRAEIAVYRGGIWYTLNLVNNQFQAVRFGISTDKPVPADFDGDGKTDYAVYRDGIWYLLRSSQGFSAVQFGIATDKPVIGDYDGDGKSDQAVYRSGVWYILGSIRGFYAVQFGIASDIPVAADYDGDGRTDIAVFRDGVWYWLQSSNNQFRAVQFGSANDRPIPVAFVP